MPLPVTTDTVWVRDQGQVGGEMQSHDISSADEDVQLYTGKALYCKYFGFSWGQRAISSMKHRL